jgi:hypothetical protein
MWPPAFDVCGNVTERFAVLCVPQPDGGFSPDDCVVEKPVFLPAHWQRCSWVSNGSLLVKSGAVISCANRTTRCANSTDACEPAICELSFSFAKKITFDQFAAVRAGTVVLSTKGRLTMARNASIDTSALGLCGGANISYEAPYKKRMGRGVGGAGHGGKGGTCGAPGSEMRHQSWYGEAYGIGSSPRTFNAPAVPQRDRPYFGDLYGVGTHDPYMRNQSKRMCCGEHSQRSHPLAASTARPRSAHAADRAPPG